MAKLGSATPGAPKSASRSEKNERKSDGKIGEVEGRLGSGGDGRPAGFGLMLDVKRGVVFRHSGAAEPYGARNKRADCVWPLPETRVTHRRFQV